MTTDKKVARRKPSLLELATDLQNVNDLSATMGGSTVGGPIHIPMGLSGNSRGSSITPRRRAAPKATALSSGSIAPCSMNASG